MTANAELAPTRPVCDWRRTRRGETPGAEHTADGGQTVRRPEFRRFRAASRPSKDPEQLLQLDHAPAGPPNGGVAEKPTRKVRPTSIFALSAVGFAGAVVLYLSLTEARTSPDIPAATRDISLRTASDPGVLSWSAALPQDVVARARLETPTSADAESRPPVRSSAGRVDAPVPPRNMPAKDPADAVPQARAGEHTKPPSVDEDSASLAGAPEASASENISHLLPTELALLEDLARVHEPPVYVVEHGQPEGEPQGPPTAVAGQRSSAGAAADARAEAPRRTGEEAMAADYTAHSVPVALGDVPPPAGEGEAGDADGAIYRIQLISVGEELAARRAWELYRNDFPAVLGRLDSVIERAEIAGSTVYRVRAGKFPSRPEAERICRTLKGLGADCLVVAALK